MALSQLEKNDMNWCFDFHNWVNMAYEEHKSPDGRVKYWTWRGDPNKKKHTKTQVYISFVKSH